MLKSAVFAALVLVVLSARAQNLPPATLWHNAGHVELSVTHSTGRVAAWQFDRADNGDVRVIKEEQRGATKVSGTLLSVCNDQALLFKDIVPVKHRELHELDEPILHLQLVLRLLARALPQGPLAVGADANIDVGEQKNPVRVRKGSSVRRDFLAPWQARGKIARRTPQSFSFELAFSHAGVDAAERRDEMKMTGVWQTKSDVSVFDNAFAIADWQVYRVDTEVNYVGGNAQFEPFLVLKPLSFKTLGELRARIERVWSEDPKARKQAECKL